MAWYRAGTIKVTANSATVTGTGTTWVQNARVGDGLQGPDGRMYEVTNIASNTSLSITPAYQGASATGQTYWIIPVQGYIKQSGDRLAAFVDQFGQLPAQVAGLGTASQGTVTTTTNDATPGRVFRTGDWGVGVNAGLEADPIVLNNNSNGFYRSGAGAGLGKPVNQSGDGYIKFGWSGSYKTYLYGSPVADGLWFQNVNNGVAQGWKKVVAEGMYGLGTISAGGLSAVDSFPSNDLGDLGVGAGIYYVPPGATGLPDGVLGQGAVLHRQSGSGGGQLFISFRGEAAVRGRRSGEYGAWGVTWTSRNTTVDSNGFLKKASPIVELSADGFKKTDHLETKDVRFERLGTGHYVLQDAPRLSRDGWYIETPKDRNNNIYFTLDYEEDEQNKTLTIRTYEPDYSTGRATNGEPVDILEGRFVSLRFAENPDLYPVYVPDPEPVPAPEPDLEPGVDLDQEPLPEPIEEPAA